MLKVKFTFSRKTKPKKKEEEYIPLIFTYHPSLKYLSKIINKNLYLLHMNDEIKRVFSAEVIISFRSASKFSNYLVRDEIYSKVHENERKTWKLYLLNYTKGIKKQLMIKLLQWVLNLSFDVWEMFQTVFAETTEIFCKWWYNYKSNARKFFRELNCIQEHMLEHFQSPHHNSFVEGFCITFIDTANPFLPTKHEDWKFYIRKNNKKDNSIETGLIIIAHLLSD